MIIRCWLCQKEVDKLSMRYSELHMALIVTVWCHGEKDECYIADQTMAEALNGEADFQQGIAFQPKGIEHENVTGEIGVDEVQVGGDRLRLLGNL